MEQSTLEMAICTGQGNRVTATIVNPSTSMKHLPGHISVPTAPFQANKTTDHSTPAQLSRAHHVLNRVLIKTVPRGVFKLRNVNTAEMSSCN